MMQSTQEEEVPTRAHHQLSDVEEGETIVIRQGPNLCRYKKSIVALSIVLVVSIAVAVSFSLKSKTPVDRQTSSEVSAASDPNLPLSDNFQTAVEQPPLTGESSSNPTTTPTSSTSPPTASPTKLGSPSDPASGDDICLVFEFVTDGFGEETSWQFETNPEDGSPSEVIVKVPSNTYGNFIKDVRTVCVPQGKYKLTVEDPYGGMCCVSGEGYYSVSIGDSEILHGGSFKTTSISHDILVGFNPVLTDYEKEWLDGHNTRRESYHTSEGLTYRPLAWSPELAKSAEGWIDQLLPTCLTTSVSTQPGIPYGENIFKVTSSVSQVKGPENVLQRWVDAKLAAGRGYPQNDDMTQVLWRSTSYVGCANKDMASPEGYCNIFVCRYARAGNCGMSLYSANEGDNWKIPVGLNYTKCGPDCAPEGCFA